jgi:hypothetical protein
MEDFAPTLFSRIILYKEIDVSILTGSAVALQIDASYTIGKSIAVLHRGDVIGHLDRRVAPVVWRFLRSGTELSAEVLQGIGNWKNERWFSVVTHSFEIGVKIRFFLHTREDARLLLIHIARWKLNSFPGVEVENCPTVLLPLVRPVKDENGVTSLQFPPLAH